MNNLKNKTVLITGGTSGLGFELAKKFLDQHCKVIITGRNQKNLDSAAKKLKSNNLTTAFCDITQVNQIKNLFKTLTELDILVNNAGVWLEGALEKNSDEHILTTINTNFTGLAFTTREAIPLMKKSKGVASIVNISSTAGIEPKQKNPVYAATKYAVKGLTDCLNVDFRNTNLRAIGVYPGGMNTPLFSKAMAEKDMTGYMNPEDVAQTIVEILNKPDNMVVDTLVIRRTKY